MARDFICTLRASGGDYTSINAWRAAIACDLTSSTTKVFIVSDRGTYTPSDDGKTVTFTGGGTGTLKHINVYNQALIVNCSGTIQPGTVTIANGHTFTISDTGEQIGDAILSCYNDWPDGLDESYIDIKDFITNSEHHVKIWTDPNESGTQGPNRHNGTAESGFYIKNSGNYYTFVFRISNVILEGIEIQQPSKPAYAVLYNTDNSFVNIFRKLIIHNVGGIIYNGGSSRVENSIFYDFGSSGYSAVRFGKVYNCTVYAIDCGSYSNQILVRDAECYNVLLYSNNSGTGYNDFYNCTGDYNIGSDSSVPGSHSIKNVTLDQIKFVSTTPGSEDLHIQADSIARDAGTDLSAYFTDDIDGDTRSGTWDIGADEYVAGIEEETISINYQFDTVAKRLNLYESYSLDSLIKALGLEKTYAFDEIQSRELVKNYLIDALQKKVALSNYKMNAIQSIINARSYLIDVFQGKFFTKTFPINSLAKRLGVTTSHAFDILLTLAEEYGIISAKFDEARFGYSYFNRIFSGYPINTVIRFIPRKHLSFDGLLASIGVHSVDFDTVISRLNEILTYNIAGLIEKLNKELYKIDAVLQQKKEQKYDIDALLKKRSEIQQTIDSLLQIQKKNDHLIDALLLSAIKSEYDYDALLSKTKEIGLESDTILAFLAAIASINLDTITLKQNELAQLFDSILSRKLTAAEFIDAVIEKLGIDREYIMNAILSTILERSHFINALAERLEIDRSILIDAILGQAKARDLSINAIAKRLDISTDYLFDAIAAALVKLGYNINAMLSAIQERHLSFDATFQKIGRKIQSALDTILQASETEDMALDVVLTFLREGKIPFDLFVLGTITTELALETLIEKTDIQTQHLVDTILSAYTLKTHKLNALLKSTELRGILIDILTSLVESKNISFDSITEQLGISKEMILDSVSKRIGIPTEYTVNLLSFKTTDRKHVLDTILSMFRALNYGIDSLLEIAAKEDYTLKAILNAFGLEEEFIFSIVLTRVGGLRLVLFDTLLGITTIKYFTTDVLFKKIMRRDVVLDTMMELLISKQLNTDMILTKSLATSLFFDALLALPPQEVHHTIDIMLQGVVKRVLRTSVNLVSYLFIDEAVVRKSRILGIYPDSSKLYSITPAYSSLYDIVVSNSPLFSISTSTSPVMNVYTSYISA